MSELEMERIYTIPLRKVKAGSRNKMANRAIREVRSYLSKHMKSEDVWIDAAVNQFLWSRGMYNVPSKIRVRAVKFDDGVVEVSLPEEDRTTSIRETLKEERESRQPVLATTTEDAEAALEGLTAEEETETDGTAEIEATPEGETEAETEADTEAETETEAAPPAEGEVGPGADTDAETPPEDKGAVGSPEKAPEKGKAKAQESETKEDPAGHADSEKDV